MPTVPLTSELLAEHVSSGALTIVQALQSRRFCSRDPNSLMNTRTLQRGERHNRNGHKVLELLRELSDQFHWGSSQNA